MTEKKRISQDIEKIEVSKKEGIFWYTGTLKDIGNGWVEINTTRGECMRYRKEQIEQRLPVKAKKRKEGDYRGQG
ncbi:MAG: hypothetical protein GY861_17080 [bacterium]|nr:hypothetical protein [bacterium]